MQLTRGMRDKLNKYINEGSDIIINMNIVGPSVYDFCCFGVDSADKLSDEDYMIFYNQTASPAGEIKYKAATNAASFIINLSKIPQHINKLVFTVSIDGNGTMGNIASHTLSLSQNGAEALSLNMHGSDFSQEKAIISVEIYRKDEWRINTVANGFNGGLSALLSAFGGVEATEKAAPAPAYSQLQPSGGVNLKKNEQQLANDVMKKISLSKDKTNLERHVVSLSKTVVNLSKKSGVDMSDMRARVVVVLDFSGSMNTLYNNGTVQNTINKLVPLGLTFDDNGSIDVFLFQNDYRKIDDLVLSNYENYISNVVMRSGYRMGGTNYAPVLKAIILGSSKTNHGFFGINARTTVVPALVTDKSDPTFILFITDGDNADKIASDDIIRKSSEYNVFIQFIGIGSSQFNYLRRLDDMPGRKRDNTGFCAMRDLNSVSDDVLYTNVLEQFSQWLKGMQ